MGAIRSMPENEVNTLSDDQLKHYAVTASCCGWQFYMEDYEVSERSGSTYMYAVIDGHNGPQVAKFCHQQLPHLFKKNDLIKMGQLDAGVQSIIAELQMLVKASSKFINEIRVEEGMPALPADQPTRSGCSIVLAVFSDEDIVIANVGHCKCYVVYEKDRSKAVLFAGNHSLSNPDEEARVIKANGFNFNGRVNGIYPYTRSIGDLHLKDDDNENRSLLIAQPSIFRLRREDIYQVVIGSSGAWERPQQVIKNIGFLGKSYKQDLQTLQFLVSSMIAKEPNAQKIGLDNILLTQIRLKH